MTERNVLTDERRLFHQLRYHQMRVEANFVQDNISLSKKGMIRVRCFHSEPGQMKHGHMPYTGEVFDVFVDICPNSPTFGNWGAII